MTYRTFDKLMILKTGVCKWTGAYEIAPGAGQRKACANNDDILTTEASKYGGTSSYGGIRFTKAGLTAKRCDEICNGHP